MIRRRLLDGAVLAALTLRSDGYTGLLGGGTTTNIPGDTDAGDCTQLFEEGTVAFTACVLFATTDEAKCICVDAFDTTTAGCNHEDSTESQDIDMDGDEEMVAKCRSLAAAGGITTSSIAAAVVATATYAPLPIAVAGNVAVTAAPSEESSSIQWWQILLLCLVVVLLVVAGVAAMMFTKPKNQYEQQVPMGMRSRAADSGRPYDGLRADEAEMQPLNKGDGIPFPVPEATGQKPGPYAQPPGYGQHPGTMAAFPPGGYPGAYHPGAY